MIRLDAATVLLQWATGGLAFLWVTTRRREVGIGYGWLLRAVYGVLAVGAAAVGGTLDSVPVRDACAAGLAVATTAALVVSIVRRKAGVAGERARHDRKAARVAVMAGTEPPPAASPAVAVAEFPPALDLVAPLVGIVGLIAAGTAAGGPHALAVGRTLAGALFLGAVSDAMLLGHWYLVQPGLGRGPLFELNRWLALTWPIEVGLLLWPTGMLSVLSGRVDDGWNGTLGWFWVA
ncbi:MAG: hypothetical protein M3066_06585, partial [Actinomycetota bacterium]|nr:hypothetical protein [Actinomycetota bacterium]